MDAQYPKLLLCYYRVGSWEERLISRILPAGEKAKYEISRENYLIKTHTGSDIGSQILNNKHENSHCIACSTSGNYDNLREVHKQTR